MSDRKQIIRDRRHEKDLSKIPTLSECISRARNGVTSLKKNKKRLVAKKRCRKFMSSMKKSLRLKSVEKFAAKVGILPTNSIHQQSNDNNSKTSLTKLKSKLFLARKNMAPFQSDIRPSAAWLRKNQTSISRTIVSSICTSSIVALCGGGTIIGTGIAYAAGATLSVAISDAMLSPSKNNRSSAQPKKRKNNHSDNKQEEQDKAIKRARNCELSPNFQRKMTSKHVRN